MSDRDQYVEKMKAMLDQWNAEIDKLEAKMRAEGAEARGRYAEQMAKMKEERDHAEAKWREFAEASRQGMTDMQRGFEDAWQAMSEAYDRAMKRYG